VERNAHGLRKITKSIIIILLAMWLLTQHVNKQEFNNKNKNNNGNNNNNNNVI
jgi:hypothetical protein